MFRRFLSTTIRRDQLTITRVKTPGKVNNLDSLVFGHTFSDHMLTVPWTKASGWAAPRIAPLENLSLHPAASVFHYALECFEGMKAYRDAKGGIRLFRPDRNMARLASSAERLCFPPIDTDGFLACLEELIRVDAAWIPNRDGFSLYIRPTLIATTEWLGVGPTTQCLLYCITSPVGPYYPSGFKPVQLFAEPSRIRAAVGGTGAFKIGGNYAPTILPQVEAAAKNYSQVLWLQGKDHELTEVGTMNLFTFWINEQGEKELVTAPLTDGTILPGVTRESILDLARASGEFKVSERKVVMADVVKAVEEGRMLEMFGAGTAVIVSPVEKIHYQGKDFAIPLDKNDPTALAGPLASKMYNTIVDIQYGRVDSPWSKKIN